MSMNSRSQIAKRRARAGGRISVWLVMFGLAGTLALPGISRADDVFFPIYRFTGQAATNRTVLVTPLALFPAVNQLADYDRQPFNTVTNGYFLVTNMMRGFYQGTIQAPPDRTVFYFFVETNGTGGPVVWVNTILRATPQSVERPQDYAYSATASDARYGRAGAGGLSLIAGPGIGFIYDLISATIFTTNIPPSALPGYLSDWSQVPTSILSNLGTNSTAPLVRGAAVLGNSVTLTWDPVATATNYQLFWGVASRTYTNSILAGTNIAATVSNLTAGTTYYFAVASLADGMDSAYSDEVPCALTVAGITNGQMNPIFTQYLSLTNNGHVCHFNLDSTGALTISPDSSIITIAATIFGNAFFGPLVGDGAGITGIHASALPGLSTNVVCGSRTLLITNGLIMGVQ
jgi:hypothetical protein